MCMERGFVTFERGKGFPLVLLHGLLGDPENWSGVMETLPETCRSIALEFPFFRDDSRLNNIPVIRDYARAYIEEAELEQMVLGGNSLGGHVSLHLALEMPEKIRGLVLTGSSGLYEREITGPRGANPSREWLHQKMCEVFYDNAMVTDALIDNVCHVIDRRKFRRDLVLIAKSAKRDNLADRLSEIRCPVLLVWGKQDEITPPHVAEEFKSLLPDSELAWLDQCGHAPMLEQPRAFADVLSEWWNRRIVSDNADRICNRAS